MAIISVNPATGKLIKSYDEHTSEEIIEAIEKSHKDFLNWRTVPFNDRKKLMYNAAEILKKRSENYGRLLTMEMGKTIKQAIAEVEKCAWVCEYYAENAGNILKPEIIATDASKSYVRFDPLGIILAVMPWNFPFWQVFRFAAPALMAGNAGLLKHASNVPGSALAIEEIFIEAGFPENLFRTLLIGSGKVNDVINHELVKAATLTGSEFAGQKVAGACGNKLKKTVMELGGSDPFIVLTDADIDKAVETAVTARITNNGQSCIAAKRFIVVKEVYNEFEQKFADKLSRVKMGDPMNENTELGPIAREDLLMELINQVERSVATEAKLLTGGIRPDSIGYYYPATLLTNVKKGMPAYHEEIFGPVASLIYAEDESDVITIANDTSYGLGAALFTSDLEKAEHLSEKIEAGSVFINGMVKSDPRLPFGGIKLSGYGRELSHYGIKEFTNIKSVWVK